MADTVRTIPELLTIFADGQAPGSITPQDVRDLVVSMEDSDDALGAALGGKADASHTHTFASLTSKPTDLAGYGITDAASDAELAGEVATLEAADSALDARVTAIETDGPPPEAHAASHANGGLDEVALDASQITTGVFDIARLATGTPDGTKFVRDDGTLATPAGGGGGAGALDDLSDVTLATPASGDVLTYDGTTWENAAPTGGPPSGTAGGVLSGTYPNPGFAADMATQAELNAAVAPLATQSALNAVESASIAADVLLDGRVDALEVARLVAIPFQFGDGVNADVAGAIRTVRLPFGFTPSRWIVDASASCTATFTVEKSAAGAESWGSLVGSGTAPALAASAHAADTDGTLDWTGGAVAQYGAIRVTLSTYTAGSSKRVTFTLIGGTL